ncbi:MAG: hypothetical protein HOM96_03950 [Rickettsiales bacterium]|nr:hypothetical protein [Rickettsiales bacterium]
MYAISRYSGEMINMNYTISDNKVTISGKSLKNEYINGKLLSPKQIKNMNIASFINLPNNGREGYDYSFVRLVSKPSGEIIDCFILQNSARRFEKGGHGSCYNNSGDAFDLNIENVSFWDFF